MGLGPYQASVSESCVSSDSGVGDTFPDFGVDSSSMGAGLSPGTGAGSWLVVGVGSLSVVVVGSAPAEGMGSVAPAGVSFSEVRAGSASAGGVDSASSSMWRLESPGTGRLEGDPVTAGAWVLLALPFPSSNFTSSSSWLYMGSGQCQE